MGMMAALMRSLFLTALTASLLVLSSREAQAQINSPGQHPQGPELEPHLILNPFDTGDKVSLGLGFRGTWQFGRNNFVDSINNSVGVGVGLDWLPYRLHHGDCCGGALAIPVMLQWSFYFVRSFSMFIEPGVVAYFDDGLEARWALQIGARWHFSSSAALTFRLGYPYTSLGVSFM